MRNLKKETNKVYKTSDLSVFNQLKGNRPPNPKHIARLCHSIEQNGVLQNPIIVNENMDVIDGQHRLLAAKKSISSIYYIIVEGYGLNEVQVLNLNQKNWTMLDFMNGYSDMGIESYIKLRDFMAEYKDFKFSNCLALCSNKASTSMYGINQKYRYNKASKTSEVFEEGTWEGGDFKLAVENADKLLMIKPYYKGYNRSCFVSTMLTLLKNENFDFFVFLNKLKLQVSKMEDCASISQYKMLIEEIYNYRSRVKVSLRY